MTKYQWVDNPTEANVASYNPDVLNECLMHLKYDNNTPQTIRYCFNQGNVDANGNADLVQAELSTNKEYVSAGEYIFNAPSAGYYNVVLVGGGGSCASGITSMSTVAYAGGGSGAVFAGQLFLTAGNHTIIVGSAGDNNNTSIDNLVVASGGGNASLHNYNLVAANLQGGSVTVNGTVQNVTLNQAGNAGGFNNGNTPQNGGASLYQGYGKGADSGCGTGATSGYVSIKRQNANANNICYKVGGSYPVLCGTLANGEKFSLSGLNSDDAELLSNGTYIKYVGKNGDSELLKNNLYRQPYPPASSANGDVWLDTSKETLSAYKKNGASWVDFDKIPLCKFTVQNTAITAIYNFPYNQNGYDYNTQTAPYIVEEYVNGSSWYRVWSDGFKEQGGTYLGSTTGTVTFLKSFKNTDYTLTIANFAGCCYCTKTSATQFSWHDVQIANNSGISWLACGY